MPLAMQIIRNEVLFLHGCTQFYIIQVKEEGVQQELEVSQIADQRCSGQRN